MILKKNIHHLRKELIFKNEPITLLGNTSSHLQILLIRCQVPVQMVSFISSHFTRMIWCCNIPAYPSPQLLKSYLILNTQSMAMPLCSFLDSCLLRDEVFAPTTSLTLHSLLLALIFNYLYPRGSLCWTRRILLAGERIQGPTTNSFLHTPGPPRTVRCAQQAFEHG